MKRIFEVQLDSDNRICLPDELLTALDMKSGEILQIINAKDSLIVIKEEALKKYFQKN